MNYLKISVRHTTPIRHPREFRAPVKPSPEGLYNTDIILPFASKSEENLVRGEARTIALRLGWAYPKADIRTSSYRPIVGVSTIGDMPEEIEPNQQDKN